MILVDANSLIESERLGGAGIGFVPAHILRSVVASGNASLWTRDGSLRQLADRFGAAYNPHTP